MKLHKLKVGEAIGTYLAGVRTIDHIVIGNEGCVSMAVRGDL
jgi:DNA repair protein RadC